MQILVTGGAGFLGRYVVRALQARGYDRIYAPRSSEFDLRAALAVKRLFALFEPELVVHSAATVGGIGANQAEPGRFFYDNAAMALHLVETARQCKVKRFVAIGTTCSYPQ